MVLLKYGVVGDPSQIVFSLLLIMKVLVFCACCPMAHGFALIVS